MTPCSPPPRPEPLQPPRQCVILVGGLGTRLGALTASRPKPLLPVAGRPFVHYLLWHARRFGFRRALLLAGYRAEVLAEEMQALSLPGLDLEMMAEPKPLGTGGAICAASDALDEQFLLMNGDSLFDFNWLALADLMCADPRCAVAMSLRAVPDASRFGVAELRDGRVEAFHERGGPDGGLINAGVYLMRREALRGFPGAGSFEREMLPALASDGRVRGLAAEGFFLDIGVPDSYAAAQTEVPASLRRGAVFLPIERLLDPGTVQAVRQANDRGLFVFGFAHGAAAAAASTQREALRALGAHIDEVFDLAAGWPAALAQLQTRWPIVAEASVLFGRDDHELCAARDLGLTAVPADDLTLSA